MPNTTKYETFKALNTNNPNLEDFKIICGQQLYAKILNFLTFIGEGGGAQENWRLFTIHGQLWPRSLMTSYDQLWLSLTNFTTYDQLLPDKTTNYDKL